jgi:hypothetical protein
MCPPMIGTGAPLMHLRLRLAVFTAGFLLPLIGCGVAVQSITVTPAAGTEVLNGPGQTAQFHALETTQMGSATPTNHDATQSVSWSSANAAVATVSGTGLVTAVAAGKATITATDGGVSGASDVTVTQSAASTPTLIIIPSAGAATANSIGETTQFLAFGDLSGSGKLLDVTNSVHWYTSDIGIATIDQTGLATVTAVKIPGTATTITAVGTTSSGSAITATSNLTIGATGGPLTLPTLAIYTAGNGSGTITSSPGPINCGPQASPSTCTGTFTLGATVTLTAKPSIGSSLGGWSSDCMPVTSSATVPPTPSLTCQITLTAPNSNASVGAIFNMP